MTTRSTAEERMHLYHYARTSPGLMSKDVVMAVLDDLDDAITRVQDLQRAHLRCLDEMIKAQKRARKLEDAAREVVRVLDIGCDRTGCGCDEETAYARLREALNG